jgi:hypothetical protein
LTGGVVAGTEVEGVGGPVVTGAAGAVSGGSATDASRGSTARRGTVAGIAGTVVAVVAVVGGVACRGISTGVCTGEMSALPGTEPVAMRPT